MKPNNNDPFMGTAPTTVNVTDTLDLSNMNNGLNFGSVLTTTTPSISLTSPAPGPNSHGLVYTTTNTGTILPGGRVAMQTHHDGKMSLHGPNADIEINGESLTATIRALKERLNLLDINPELEQEWQELKTLGDRYRALEKTIKDKVKMWETLKK